MNFEDIPPEVSKALPGVAGSLVSMFWIKETWPRKIGMFLAGAAFSFYGGGSISDWTGLNGSFAGFLSGLFGMSVVAKLFELWSKFDLSSIFSEWIRKRLGLAPKQGE